MSFEEAKVLAREGVKMTHRYFTENEYMTMRGDIIEFEDGYKIHLDEWTKGKSYLLDGWARYE